MKAAFVLIARQKAKWAYKAAASGLAQTYPCEVILSDQHSEDETLSELMRAADTAPRGNPDHTVRVLKCPIEGEYSMRACNEHFMWLADQTQAEWLFLCSADDYSLPDRVKTCMEAIGQNDCAIVANTMYFTEPGQEIVKGQQHAVSGYPLVSGYVSAGEGLHKMAYGSTVQGYNRAWLKKVGPALDCTADVYYGYLAALVEGYYVLANPQHVHVMHSSVENMGFQGKMRAVAEGTPEHWRLAELNRFQLLDLYYSIGVRAQEMYPMAKPRDKEALYEMILAQSKGWLDMRKELHKRKIAPGVM